MFNKLRIFYTVHSDIANQGTQYEWLKGLIVFYCPLIKRINAFDECSGKFKVNNFKFVINFMIENNKTISD